MKNDNKLHLVNYKKRAALLVRDCTVVYLPKHLVLLVGSNEICKNKKMLGCKTVHCWLKCTSLQHFRQQKFKLLVYDNEKKEKKKKKAFTNHMIIMIITIIIRLSTKPITAMHCFELYTNDTA